VTTASPYGYDPELSLWCWDCEVRLLGASPLSSMAISPFCASCENHRRDGHAPERKYLRKEYCHGSGPDGRDRSRVGRVPRPLLWHETEAFALLEELEVSHV